VTVYRSAVAASPAAAARIVGISLGHADAPAAEHWLAALPVAPVYAFTHLVREPYPHVAISVASDVPLPAGPDRLRPGALAAAAAHKARTSGRAVRYPGVERLVGTLSVAELLAASAIERVHVLGGAPTAADTLIDTADHVRPQWQNGVLTLIAVPAANGRLAPFEVPHPTPCCAAH
jgi:hypothetical protein